VHLLARSGSWQDAKAITASM